MPKGKGPFTVYVYRDPRQERHGEVIYVGKGSIRTGRHRQHLWRATNARLKRKIAKFSKAGLHPIIEIVGTFALEAEAFAEEIRLIAKYGRADLGLGPLCNLSDGGDGAAGAQRSSKERQRLRDQWKNGAADAVKAGNRASWADPARRAIRIASIKEARSTPESKERFLRSRPNKDSHPQLAEKISAGLRAALASPEIKQQRSAESRRRWADDAFKLATAASIAAAHNKWWITIGDQRFGSAKEAAAQMGVTADCITMRCRKGIYIRELKV